MFHKKMLSSAALMAGLGLLAFTATPAHAASQGTINFTGKVLADTCTISVNGGSTVALPSVMTAAFGSAAGNVAGTTPFTVALKDCDTNTAQAQMQFSGSNIDTGTGNLKNTAASGSNVQIQLLNDTDTAINTATQANAPTIAVASGTGSTQLKAQYISTSATTSAGLVASTVDFTLTYQ